MEDAKVKKILSCIEEGGGYSIEHLSTFKKLYPVVIDYFHSRNSKRQCKSDVVKILSLSKLNDMYIADAKFFNRTTNKSSKRRISLMLNDTKILALIKDYEYMLKRSLRYVNDLYKELKKRSISSVDFSMENKENYIDDLFSFVKSKELTLSDLNQDYENITKYYSFQDVIDVETKKKMELTNKDDSEIRTLESANNCSFEEPSDSSVDKKVTFSSRNEIIDIPVYTTNKLGSVNKHKRKKIAEKEIITKMESKNCNNKLNTLTAYNEVYIKKKKPQTEKKDIKYSSSLTVVGENKNKNISNTNKILNQVDMSNYVDMLGFNDHNNLIADINQLYDEPYKDLNDFENMVNSSELLKNLRDDDFMITSSEESKKLGSNNLNHTEMNIVSNTIPEKNEQATSLNDEVKIKVSNVNLGDNELKENKAELTIFEDKNMENKSLGSYPFSIEEGKYTSKKNHASVNQEENEIFDFILSDGKSKENEDEENILKDKRIEKKSSNTLLLEGKAVINISPENEVIKSNLFDTVINNEKNLGLIEDIFNESKINEELEKKHLETGNQSACIDEKSRQTKESVIYEENNKKKYKNDGFRDKDILKINRKKEEKKIDASFLLSKTRFEKNK